jgi:hypothetical protein
MSDACPTRGQRYVIAIHQVWAILMNGGLLQLLGSVVADVMPDFVEALRALGQPEIAHLVDDATHAVYGDKIPALPSERDEILDRVDADTRECVEVAETALYAWSGAVDVFQLLEKYAREHIDEFVK